MFCYSGAAAVAAAPLLRLGRRPAAPAVTLGLFLAAVAAHFAALVQYAHAYGELPLSGLGPSLSSLAFLLGLLVLGILWLTREQAIALVAWPILVGPLAIGTVAGFGPSPAVPREAAAWFDLHAASSLLGLALLGVAFAAAALYLLQHRALKQRRFGVIFQFFPPLEQLDRLNHLALLGGFPVLTVGVILAVGFATRGPGAIEANPAHLAWGLLSWAVLGAIAVLRMWGRLRGKKAAYASIGGFVAISVSYLVLLVLSAGGARFL